MVEETTRFQIISQTEYSIFRNVRSAQRHHVTSSEFLRLASGSHD